MYDVAWKSLRFPYASWVGLAGRLLLVVGVSWGIVKLKKTGELKPELRSRRCD